MTALIPTFFFAAFVVAAIQASTARAPKERRTVRGFINLSLVLSFGAGLLQRDFFPFVSWPLVAGTVPDTVHAPRVAVVTPDGAEHAVDYRAWSPLSMDELLSWVDLRFASLTPREQRDAASWLLAHVDTARRSALASGHVPSPGVLGPMSAPFFLLHPRLWDVARQVPTDSLVGIRFYRDRWNLADRARGVPLKPDLFFSLDARRSR